MNNFEQFLRMKHAEDYQGTDDDMPDAFEHWFSGLDVDDILNYGNQAIIKAKIEAWKEAKQIMIKNFVK